MSSRPASDQAQADFFTTTHRISGEVRTGPRPLSDLLNDGAQSYLTVTSVYLSRLEEPGGILNHAPVAYVAKQNLNFVIVQAREASSSDRSHFSVHEYKVLVTLPGFEIEGTFSGPHRLDLPSFSPATLDTFVVLVGASARIVRLPDAPFRGEAMLVNRMRIEGFHLTE